MELKDKVVVVTGGAQGIGLSLCKRFAKGGARIVLGDIQKEALDLALGELAPFGTAAEAVQVDITKEADAERLMQTAIARFGRLDIAVLNAGILRDGLLVKVDRQTGKVIDKMSLRQWQTVIDVNLTGVFLTGREAAVRMIEAGNGGVIILMSSIAGAGNFGQTNYSATKAGVRAMTVTWAKELARYKIRVNAIAPGFVGTPMVLKDMKQEALDKFRQLIPVGRLGEPDEVAHVAQFIIENDYLTGGLYDVTGGMRL